MTITDMERLPFTEWERICNEEQTRSFASLSHADQVFHCIWILERQSV